MNRFNTEYFNKKTALVKIDQIYIKATEIYLVHVVLPYSKHLRIQE